MRGVACCERFARISAVAKNREAIMAGNEETRERAREEAAAMGFILHHSSWFQFLFQFLVSITPCHL
ncbi:unnamed protein product [Sphagnum tenellum]